MNKMPEFYMIRYLLEKYYSPIFQGQFPAPNLRVSGLSPNTNYVIVVDIVLRA